MKSYTKKALIRYSSADDGVEGEKRSHRFVLKPDDGDAKHGIIRYGSFGYATDVEEVSSGVVAHKRTKEQADTVPLYHRFWWPERLGYGLWGFQSYSGKSCARAILNEFRSFYRERHPDYNIEATKVVPSELTQYANSRVKKISIVKKRAPARSVSKALRPESSDAEIDIEIEVRARGRSVFGTLKNVADRFSGKPQLDGMQDVPDYTSAFATIDVGGASKKIGIFGISTTTGVIDVTDSVDFDASMMPTFKTISVVTKSELADFAKRLGT
ncbi:MAG: hypothetical protein ACK42D_04775 [Candidatus Paceibacteria bacterium]